VAQDRQKRKKRSKSRAVVLSPAKPARFEHSENRRISRRALVTMLVIVLSVALIVPTIIAIGLFRDSVPNPITGSPGGTARLVTDTTP
jgi:hypothetical protein